MRVPGVACPAVASGLALEKARHDWPAGTAAVFAPLAPPHLTCVRGSEPVPALLPRAGAFGGGLCVPLCLGTRPGPIGNDFVVTAAVIAWFIVHRSPGDIGFKCARGPVRRGRARGSRARLCVRERPRLRRALPVVRAHSPAVASLRLCDLRRQALRSGRAAAAALGRLLRDLPRQLCDHLHQRRLRHRQGAHARRTPARKHTMHAHARDSTSRAHHRRHPRRAIAALAVPLAARCSRRSSTSRSGARS